MKLPEFFVLDITNTSAKSILFEASDNAEQKLAVKGVSTRDSYQSEIPVQAAKAMVEECAAQADSNTNEAIVGLSGSNVMGFILIVKSKRDNPDKEINEKELDKLYEKVRTSALTQVKERWSTFFAGEADFEPLDLVVTSIHIDDEPVDNPEGMTGETIQLSVFCSYSEKNYYDKIMKVISKVGFSVLTVTTTLYSQVKVLSQRYNNFVLIDSGKDYTDLAVVFGKNIIQTRSFGIGGEFFTEHVSIRMGIEHAKAKGQKEAYSLGTMPTDDADKLSDVLYDAGLEWRNGVVASLNSMTGIKSFPDKIILSGGNANLDVLQELLTEDEWHQSIAFGNSPEVITAESDLWKSHIKDELNILNDVKMFVPASLGLIKLELDQENG